MRSRCPLLYVRKLTTESLTAGIALVRVTCNRSSPDSKVRKTRSALRKIAYLGAALVDGQPVDDVAKLSGWSRDKSVWLDLS